ncbi:MAG: DNA polymerase IV [Cyclobacteriaceae bacterium]|nr:DNA polymerase IV [Cyclobacteriaceae bacterium]
MDAFFVSVEQRDNPELRGKPVAVGGDGDRGVIAAASYEARKFGVFSAMSSKVARRKCPDLIFVKHRFDAYKAASLVIRSIFREYTDLVEPLSLDEAFLDVTHNKKGIAIATDIALGIKARIKGQTDLTASAGVSVNKFLAKIASDMDKPNGLFVVKPHQVDHFVAGLAIEKFFGVGKVTAAKMKAKGIFTGADLKKESERELVKWFGKAGHYFFNVARGIDNRPVVSHQGRKSLGAESTFSEDYSDKSILLEKLHKVAMSVNKRLAKSGGLPKTLTVKIKFADFTQITRSKTVVNGISTLEQINLLASELLEKALEPFHKIRLLGISLSNFEGEKQKKAQGQLTLEL